MDGSAEMAQATASAIQLWGAGGFGAIIGWYVYYINRYRKEAVQFSDLSTVIGIVGGGAVLALFPTGTDLFGAYGIGLFVGFFGYFLTLLVLIGITKNFDVDWLLDGRRKKLKDDEFIPDAVMDRIAHSVGMSVESPPDEID